MTETERSKVLIAARIEAQIAWEDELDGASWKMREHRTAFYALMRLAVNLGIATEEDEETIWEDARVEAMDFDEWKKERAAQMKEEGKM